MVRSMALHSNGTYISFLINSKPMFPGDQTFYNYFPFNCLFALECFSSNDIQKKKLTER